MSCDHVILPPPSQKTPDWNKVDVYALKYVGTSLHVLIHSNVPDSILYLWRKQGNYISIYYLIQNDFGLVLIVNYEQDGISEMNL